MKWIGLLALVLIDALIVGYLLRIERRKADRRAHLLMEGVRASARVESLAPAGKNGSQQIGTLVFNDLRGAAHRFSATWPNAEVDHLGLRVGASVPMRYLSEEPTYAAVDSSHQQPIGTKVVVGGGLFIFALIVLAAVVTW
jgi:hypothetical protein